MKGMSVVRVMVVLSVLAMVAGSVWAQGGGQGGQRQGRGGQGGGMGGMMGRMQYLENTWCWLGFELGATTEQYMKLFPIYKQAWDYRKDALAKARENRDFQAIGTAMQQVQDTLEKALNETLTAEQKVIWEKLKAEQASQMQRGPGGGQGGPGGQGGGGGQAGGPVGPPPQPGG